MTLDELAVRCHQELRQVADLPDPAWTRVIAEKRATIASVVAAQKVPTEIDGVLLAGDYTDPDYPPTLESAVRSGVRAAQLASNSSSGCSTRALKPRREDVDLSWGS
jgi:hypothetical protein